MVFYLESNRGFKKVFFAQFHSVQFCIFCVVVWKRRNKLSTIQRANSQMKSIVLTICRFHTKLYFVTSCDNFRKYSHHRLPALLSKFLRKWKSVYSKNLLFPFCLQILPIAWFYYDNYIPICDRES